MINLTPQQIVMDLAECHDCILVIYLNSERVNVNDITLLYNTSNQNHRKKYVEFIRIFSFVNTVLKLYMNISTYMYHTKPCVMLGAFLLWYACDTWGVYNIHFKQYIYNKQIHKQKLQAECFDFNNESMHYKLTTHLLNTRVRNLQ